MRHLLSIRTLSVQNIERIFQTAKYFKDLFQRPMKKVPALRGITIANVFFEPSTRTKLSFELAEKRLSADVINFSSTQSALKKGETILDTIRNILHMRVDMIVVRHSQAGTAHFLAKHVQASIINAGDGTHEHPTQALLDAFSITEALQAPLKKKKILILGDILHSRVALSNILCFQKLGAEVMICGPPTLLPPHAAKALDVKVSYHIDEALQWCEIVNVLRIQWERQTQNYIPSLREYALHYGLTKPRIKALHKAPLIIHPGPINRGVEIDSALADDASSIILKQVENGVAVRMAVLCLLVNPHREFI